MGFSETLKRMGEWVVAKANDYPLSQAKARIFADSLSERYLNGEVSLPQTKQILKKFGEKDKSQVQHAQDWFDYRTRGLVYRTEDGRRVSFEEFYLYARF